MDWIEEDTEKNFEAAFRPRIERSEIHNDADKREYALLQSVQE